MDVSNKYFHGISLGTFEYKNGMSDFKLLNSILEDHFLLTRDSLKDKHYEYYKVLADRGFEDDMMDVVSVCCHLDKNNDYLSSLSKNVLMDDEDSAFETFVYNQMAVVLDSKVLMDSLYLKEGMLGEFKVFSDISLDYMCALGIPNYFERIIYNVDDILLNGDCSSWVFQLDYYVRLLKQHLDLKKFVSDGYQKFGVVRGMLERYGYDVPIIDSFTGQEWLSERETYEKLMDVKARALEKKLIKF